MTLPNLDELGIQFTDNPDGTVEAKLPTGEVFKGSMREVAAHALKAKVYTRQELDRVTNDRDEWKQKAEAVPVQPTQPQSQEDPQVIQTRIWITDQVAKGLGYANTEQLLQERLREKQEAEQYRNNIVSATFLGRNQDFPNTPDAIEKLSNTVDKMGGWNTNNLGELIERMEGAHARMLRDNQRDPSTGYAGLKDEHIEIANGSTPQHTFRPTPPPLVRGGNPEQAAPQFDPWRVPLDELRNKAIRDQLGEK